MANRRPLGQRLGRRNTHDCPAKHCTRQVDHSKLMCPAHWAMVPKPMQTAVYAAWNYGEGEGTPAHNAAIRQAVKAVNDKLGD